MICLNILVVANQNSDNPQIQQKKGSHSLLLSYELINIHPYCKALLEPLQERKCIHLPPLYKKLSFKTKNPYWHCRDKKSKRKILKEDAVLFLELLYKISICLEGCGRIELKKPVIAPITFSTSNLYRVHDKYFA